jgi:hypothetical protein
MEEGIGRTTLAGKVVSSLNYFRPVAEEPGIQVRCHAKTLYNSIFRFDDEVIVNTHAFGFMAAHSPVLHIRRLSAGDMFETYSESFEIVWGTAKPPTWPED